MCVDCKKNTFNTFSSNGVQFVHKQNRFIKMNHLNRFSNWFAKESDWMVLRGSRRNSSPTHLTSIVNKQHSNAEQYMSTWIFLNDLI